MGKTGKLERFEPNVWMNRNVCVGLFHLCEYLRSDDLCRFIFWDRYCISHQTIHRFFRNFIVTRKWWSNNPFNESMLNFDVLYDQQRQMTLNDRIYIYIYWYIRISEEGFEYRNRNIGSIIWQILVNWNRKIISLYDETHHEKCIFKQLAYSGHGFSDSYWSRKLIVILSQLTSN